MLRVAIFSDIHGNLSALRAVLAAIDRHRPVQLRVAAGDLVSPAGARPAETLDLLLQAECALLLGNHDVLLWNREAEQLTGPFAELVRQQEPWAVSQLGTRRIELLQGLPQQLRVAPAAGQDLLIVHASTRNPLRGHAATLETPPEELRQLYGGANARVIAFGHYHDPFIRGWDEGTLVNVASVSLPKDEQPLASYSILTWQNSGGWTIEQHRVPYDVGEERAALAVSGIPT
jgi:predicted phosphodiesterase